MAASVVPPSAQELPKLQQELMIWMAHKGYQLQPKERSQVWRVTNTSITASTGSGIGAYYLLRHLRPSMKFPLDIIPPFIMFYVTHRAAQAIQMPGLYNSFLSLTTPLGVQARDILEALRGGGRLPSHEFGTQLPTRPPRPAPGSAAPAGPPGAERPAPSAAPAGGPMAGLGSAAGAEAPAPGGWGEEGNSGLDPGSDWGSGSGGWGDGTEASNAKRPPQPRSWDEIRAMNARKEG